MELFITNHRNQIWDHDKSEGRALLKHFIVNCLD